MKICFLIPCILNTIKLIISILLLKLYACTWVMFWLIIIIILVSFANGYWKGINKK